MRRTGFGLALALLALAAAPEVGAVSLRCGNDLVNEGDHAYLLLSRCGEPDHREPLIGHGGPGYGFSVERRRWFYNFGPQRFLHVVEVRGDRVHAIDTAGYGFDEGIRGRCQPRDLRAGMTKLELLMRCGEPDYRDHRQEALPVPRRGTHPRSLLRIEEWLYDFEGDGFTRVLRLREGIVRQVELGPRP